MNKSFKKYLILSAVLLAALASPALTQTGKKKPPVKKPVARVEPSPELTPSEATPSEHTPQPAPGKKNGRPGAGETVAVETVPKPAERGPSVQYNYEFMRDGFVVPFISITHDDTGKGKISFRKRGVDEPQSDPIILSSQTLSRINDAIAALDFLDSAADYQYAKDYSHLGNVTFTYQKDGRARTTKFNWTENKDARALADEYRKISNQYVWQFDITVARENQPLEAPQLLDALDGYLRRGEISDPKQMLPLLKQLSNDERIPLIARNHATKLATQIEKDKK